MNAFLEGIITVALAIVGLAVISVLVSKNAQTPAVFSSVGSALANDLKAAEGPVLNNTLGMGFGS
jgi:hypothetical protein